MDEQRKGPYQVRISAEMRRKWRAWCRRTGWRQAPAVEAALETFMEDEDRLAGLRAKMRRGAK